MLVTAVIRKIGPGKVSRHADKVKAKKREKESLVSPRVRRSAKESVEMRANERRKGKQTLADEGGKRETRVASIDRCVGSHPRAWMHHRSNGYANGPSVTR